MGQALKDHKGRPVIVVTGIGVVTSLGEGRDDNWDALTSGKSGIRKITRFPTDGLRTQIAGLVDLGNGGEHISPAHSLDMAMRSANEALEQSGIGSPGAFPGPLFLAVPPVDLDWSLRAKMYRKNPDSKLTGYPRMIEAARSGDFTNVHDLFQFGAGGEYLAEKLGTRGMPVALSTACATGATAIQMGVEAILRGDTDAALCVATDGSTTEEMVVRFSLLSALTTQNDPPERASKPFSKNRDGFVMAEGSATLVLETYESAKARGAKILGIIRGRGERADDFHRTRSKPDGSAIIGAINNVLSDSGVEPEEIDYINAHGTSTPENDKMEHFSLDAAFGECLQNIPISSNKSMIGHTLIAAGAIEAVFSVMTIQTGVIPPTINWEVPDPTISLDVVPNIKREKDVRTVLSNSFGFGGQNVCLVFSGEPA